MTSPLDGTCGSNVPDVFSLDPQPLLRIPEKVTICKDRTKYSQKEEYIIEGERENRNNI